MSVAAQSSAVRRGVYDQPQGRMPRGAEHLGDAQAEVGL